MTARVAAARAAAPRAARGRVATGFAPASVGNVGVGFDILGHSIAGPGDRVTVERLDAPLVRIDAIDGTVPDLPRDPARNTAGRAVEALRAAHAPHLGFALAIHKGIPLGSGLGGSAASAVAALVAANALLDAPLPLAALYPYALAGESVASGSAHGDNVGPQLLGGLVLATRDRLVPVPVPQDLYCAVVHPALVVETRRAREALREPYAIGGFVEQSANLALVLAGCFRDDFALIRAGLADVLVEPRRAPLIPGFEAVKRAALDHDALGATISGAGPSVFGWFVGRAAAGRAGAAMRAAFAAAGLDSTVYASPVAGPGARVEPTP
jgi:homoserine kinase